MKTFWYIMPPIMFIAMLIFANELTEKDLILSATAILLSISQRIGDAE